MVQTVVLRAERTRSIARLEIVEAKRPGEVIGSVGSLRELIRKCREQSRR